MKKIIVAALLLTTMSKAQIHIQNEDRFSIQISTDSKFSKKGIEFQAEFSNGVYIRPQIHYENLKDGYIETSAGMGLNLNYNRWNYKSGIKLGLIHRAATYPIFAAEVGTEYHISEKLGIGLRVSYDARGDSDFYDKKDWVFNSQFYLKFIL